MLAALLSATPSRCDDALRDAIRAGDAAEVTRLLDAGADPNELRDDGELTALGLAIEGGQTEIARLLLDRGADLREVRCGDQDSPALELAASKNLVEIAELLIERGANPNQEMGVQHTWTIMDRARGLEVIRVLLEHGASPADKLVWATRGGDLELMKLLLDFGAHPDVLWTETGTHSQDGPESYDSSLLVAIAGDFAEGLARIIHDL